MSGLRAGTILRTLTVMFTDLVGSTELFSRLGEDTADDIRLRHFISLGRAVASHGGREVQRLGDGLHAIFDSAAAAVSCGVVMQQAVLDGCSRRAAPQMSIRVGISSGDVVIEGDEPFGEAVTEASRLCAAAAAGEILVSDVTRALMRGRGGHVLVEIGPMQLKGLPHPVTAFRVPWQMSTNRGVRAVLADDAVLVREGVARLLEDCGITVVAQAGDAEQLLNAVELSRPDLVITDIRMPPTNTLEGLDAAERIRAEHPEIAVLVLSQHVDSRSGRRLLDARRDDAGAGVGYLLKERVGDVDEFIDIVRRVAAGETVLDPDLVGRLSSDGAQVA